MPDHPARLIEEEAAWCGFPRGRYPGRGEGRECTGQREAGLGNSKIRSLPLRADVCTSCTVYRSPDHDGVASFS